MNADLTYDPLDAPGATAYPITAPTYLLISTTYTDAAKGAAVKGFVRYILTDGQALAADTGFAKLPVSLASKAIAHRPTGCTPSRATRPTPEPRPTIGCRCAPRRSKRSRAPWPRSSA